MESEVGQNANCRLTLIRPGIPPSAGFGGKPRSEEARLIINGKLCLEVRSIACRDDNYSGCWISETSDMGFDIDNAGLQTSQIAGFRTSPSLKPAQARVPALYSTT